MPPQEVTPAFPRAEEKGSLARGLTDSVASLGEIHRFLFTAALPFHSPPYALCPRQHCGGIGALIFRLVSGRAGLV